jgi:hypothetical protein
MSHEKWLESMFTEKRSAPRYTLTTPVMGEALVVGWAEEIQCRLIDVSTGGARIELRSVPGEREATQARLLQGGEIISIFHKVYLGPWKIKLIVGWIMPVGDGFQIAGSYAQTPIVPIHALNELLVRREAFCFRAEQDRLIVEGELTPSIFGQVEKALADGMTLLDLTRACIHPDVVRLIEKLRATGVSVKLA